MTNARKLIPYWYGKVLLQCTQSIIDAYNHSEPHPLPLIINTVTFGLRDGEPYCLLSEERIQIRKNRQQILAFCKFGGPLTHWAPSRRGVCKGGGGLCLRHCN